MQFFLQVFMAYAAAYGYSQFPEQGGKIMGAHIVAALAQDMAGEYHRQKREVELERRIEAKYGKDKAAQITIS